MPALLRLVREVGSCAFCWRTVPADELREGADGVLLCEDEEKCCDEFRRWDYGGRWSDHPAFGERVAS